MDNYIDIIDEKHKLEQEKIRNITDNEFSESQIVKKVLKTLENVFPHPRWKELSDNYERDKNFEKLEEEPDVIDFCMLALFLKEKGYNRLLETIFKTNDEVHFSNFLFECIVADAFLKIGIKLQYEEKLSSGKSIDFLWKFEKNKIYLEVVTIHEMSKVTEDRSEQLKKRGCFKLVQEETEEIGRFQQKILEKCEKKFKIINSTDYHILIVEVNELHLESIDEYDCLNILYKNHPIVPESCRSNLVGLFDGTEPQYNLVKENICGILFVIRSGNSTLKLNSRYFFVRNNSFKSEIFEEVSKILNILAPWDKKFSSVVI